MLPPLCHEMKTESGLTPFWRKRVATRLDRGKRRVRRGRLSPVALPALGKRASARGGPDFGGGGTNVISATIGDRPGRGSPAVRQGTYLLSRASAGGRLGAPRASPHIDHDGSDASTRGAGSDNCGHRRPPRVRMPCATEPHNVLARSSVNLLDRTQRRARRAKANSRPPATPANPLRPELPRPRRGPGQRKPHTPPTSLHLPSP
jgi:hypothetical protein